MEITSKQEEQEPELPVSLTLPLPTDIPYSYGIEATSGPEGCFIQCRGTKKERDKIHYAASLVGVSYGTFIRRLANDAADQIINLFGNPEEKYTE